MSSLSTEGESSRLTLTNYRVLNILILVSLWSILLGLAFDIALRCSSSEKSVRVVISKNGSEIVQNRSSVVETEVPLRNSRKLMRLKILRNHSITKAVAEQRTPQTSIPRQQRKRFMSQRKRKRLVHTNIRSRSQNFYTEDNKQSMEGQAGPRTEYRNTETIPRPPKCLIVGFSKCGTEALKGFLSLHPDVVAPRKELDFFNKHYEEGLEWYKNQMPPSMASQITLEKTPEYILTPQVLTRIRDYNSDMKLLVMIRDPIVRLQSLYLHDLIHKTKVYSSNTTFNQWCGGSGRTAHVASIVDYASHIRDAFDIFSRRQVLVQSEEELERFPIKVLRTVESFLGLRRAFSKDNFFYSRDKGFYCFNRSISTFSKVSETVEMDTSTGCFTDSKGRPHQKIAPGLYRELVEFARPYNKHLFKLLGRRYTWENFS